MLSSLSLAPATNGSTRLAPARGSTPSAAPGDSALAATTESPAASVADSSTAALGSWLDDSSHTSPGGSDQSTPDDATTVDPEQQLLAWLSGTAALQAGTAAPTVATIALVASGTQSGQTAASSPTAPKAQSDSTASQSTSLPPPANPASVHLAAAAHTGAAQPAAGALHAPLGTSAWVEELGAQLSWMTHRGIDAASLHVSPAELGPIEVRISLHGSDASVWFGATQAATRAALEHALPQLRQLFASQGLALADAGVFREPPRGSTRQTPSRSVAPVAAARDEASRASEARSAVRLGLLDLYA